MIPFGCYEFIPGMMAVSVVFEIPFDDGIVSGDYVSTRVDTEPPLCSGSNPRFDGPVTFEPLPIDYDEDGDGCTDWYELGANPELGGDRSFVNPWDFYGVAGPGGPDVPDGVVDLANDYLQVVAHFSPTGDPPYDAHYDRGPWTGAGSWNGTAPPDGVIDLPNDTLGVIAQYNASCA